MGMSYGEMFARAQLAVGTTQKGLGEMLGVSKRTAMRYAAGRMSAAYLPELALIVAPHDRALAEIIAAEVRTGLAGDPTFTLPPAPEATPPAAPAAPPLPVLTPDAALDLVVCAAAEAMDVSPRIARTGLRAAFARAHALGIAAELVATAATKATAPAAAPSPARRRP